MSNGTRKVFGGRTLAAVLGSLLGLGFALTPSVPRAHCDTLDGPVVGAARLALEKRDVTPALQWVQKADEKEITAAFGKTLAVRGGTKDARELADRWFFETLVRLHRAGEKAPFDGLKPAGSDLPHAVVAADRALDGKLPVDTLARHVSGQVEQGIRERYARTAERKKHAGASVAAGREYVAAYVEYVHYVEGVAALAEGHGAHAAAAGEGQAKGAAHAHAD